jgi:hypothetical protein
MYVFCGRPVPVVACDTPIRVVPASASPYGKPFGDWGARWWQWGLSIPADDNPILDPTGEDCDAGQKGPVWFLAGTFGGPVERTCTVPAGKAILLPLLNWVLWYPEDNEWAVSLSVPGNTPTEVLRNLATELTDHTFALGCSVDGVPLADLLSLRGASSTAFAIDLADVIDGYEPGPRKPAVSDGHWLILAPLPRGEHTIVSQGAMACPLGECYGTGMAFEVGPIVYHLIVE